MPVKLDRDFTHATGSRRCAVPLDRSNELMEIMADRARNPGK
jgi:hypothetical protein